jgi:hypothetical protein
MSSKTLNRNDI